MASSPSVTTRPTALKSSPAVSRSPGSSPSALAMAVTPSRTRAGVLGITRIKRASLPRAARMVAVATPAAMEIRSLRRVTIGAISFRTVLMICGFTASTTMSTAWTSALLSAAICTPYWRSSSRKRSRRTSVMYTASAGTRLAASTPLMSASPMFPAPRKPTLWPLMLTTPLSRRPRRPRAEDSRSHPHHRGPFLDGHLVIGAHTHGQLAQSVALAQFPKRAKPAPRLFWTLGNGRDRHEATRAEVAQARNGVDQRAETVRSHAALGRLGPEIHLEQNVDHPVLSLGAAVQLAGQLDPVDGVDHVEERDGVPRLVGLQRADEVPGHGVSERLHLGLGFLYAVLAEGSEAGRERLPDPLDLHGLGGTDEQHVVGLPPGPLRRPRHPFAHPLEVALDVFHRRRTRDSSTRRRGDRGASCDGAGDAIASGDGGHGDEAAAMPFPVGVEQVGSTRRAQARGLDVLHALVPQDVLVGPHEVQHDVAVAGRAHPAPRGGSVPAGERLDDRRVHLVATATDGRGDGRVQALTPGAGVDEGSHDRARDPPGGATPSCMSDRERRCTRVVEHDGGTVGAEDRQRRTTGGRDDPVSVPGISPARPGADHLGAVNLTEVRHLARLAQ